MRKKSLTLGGPVLDRKLKLSIKRVILFIAVRNDKLLLVKMILKISHILYPE